MGKKRKVEQEPPYIVTYVRLHPEDHEVLKQREAATGAPIAAQIRLIVHEVLRQAKKEFK